MSGEDIPPGLAAALRSATLRVSVAERSVAIGAPVPYGLGEGHLAAEEAKGLPPPAARTVRAAADVDQGTPRIEGLPRGSSWVRDEAELQRRLDFAAYMADQTAASGHPWAAAESEQWAKTALQRGFSPGWYLIPGGLEPRAPRPMGWGFDAAMRLLTRHPGLALRYKRLTNHGWPDHNSSDPSLLMHALWARAAGQDWGRVEQLGRDLAGRLGSGLPPCHMMFKRSGPRSKALQLLWANGEGGITSWGETQSLFPRARMVWGVSSAVNIALLPEVSKVKMARRTSHRMHHRGIADAASKIAAAHRAGMTKHRSDDISGYDQSVTDAQQRQLIRAEVAHLGVSEEAAHLKVWAKDLPTLTAWGGSWQAALQKKKGGTTSGMIDTAEDGTLINAARQFECIAEASGRTPSRVEADLGKEWDFVVLGDDGVVSSTPDYYDDDLYQEASLERGFKAKLLKGVVFLMHHIDPATGQFSPLAARVHQQTALNERGGRTTIQELASLNARLGSYDGGNPWMDETLAALADGGCLAEWACTPTTTSQVLSSEAGQAALRAAVSADLLWRRDAARVVDTRYGDAPPSWYSNLVAALSSAGPTHLHLPWAVGPEEAGDMARQIADWQATPRDLRGPLPGAISDLLAQQSIAAPVGGNFEGEDDP